MKSSTRKFWWPLCLVFAFGVATLASYNQRIPLVITFETAADLNGRSITIGLSNSAPMAVYLDARQDFEICQAGKWSVFSPVLRLENDYVRPQRQVQDLTFRLPCSVDRCRVTLEYRLGGSPYCRAYGHLQKRGLVTRFPKASQWVLDWFPRKAPLQTIMSEVRFEEPSAFLAQTGD